jgi:hypothetical protein
MPQVKPWTRTLIPLSLLVAVGCQDYNFNPVGHCLIQPGSERVTLSNISTADVLFVVDDSGSMAGEQGRLAAGFDAFITNLDGTNVTRRANGLDPIDFHLAVTTTSVFFNGSTTAFCRSDCPQASGQQVCCSTSGSTPVAPLRVPKRCDSDAACGGGTTCQTDCVGFLGEKVCCDAANAAPATETVACATEGAACGSLQTHYRFDSSCAPGVGTNGALYPQGAFVNATVGGIPNPRVLHFDKELYPVPGSGAAAKNLQGFTSTELITFFKQNVLAGTCGSGQEQGLQAGRLALQKALASQQRDTRARRDATVVDTLAEWPQKDRPSKLVLVFLGDEDDCSSPQDAVRGVILSGQPGSDTCVADASLPQPKQFPVDEMVNYFASLGRPLGAAFIASTDSETCQDTTCRPGLCCDFACTASEGFPANTCRSDICGGQAPGSRLLDAADKFRLKGADVVVGSMCSNGFGTILNRIAEIVKPPSGLMLPTQPAASEITVLRIADSSGKTRKSCRGPAPAGLTYDAAVAQGWDWWFTETREQVTAEQKAPSAVSRYVFINHETRACEANPGETYSADYLGRVPEGGCQTRADCARALGGQSSAWSCFAGATGDPANPVYVAPTPAAPGTCLCGGNKGGF